MLCCSLLAVLFSQAAALAGMAKVRLFGGAGTLAATMSPVLASWSNGRWLALGSVFATEIAVATAVFPALYAIDVPHHLGAWPVCAAAARAVLGAAP